MPIFTGFVAIFYFHKCQTRDFSALSKIRKYADKNQKKRIADAQGYFMIMNEQYKHPERIRKQEKQKLKR